MCGKFISIPRPTLLKTWTRRPDRRWCSDEGEWDDQELTSECVLTTPIHVFRRVWNRKSTCSVVIPPKAPLSDYLTGFSCVYTDVHISSWHMKFSYVNVSGSFETPSYFRNLHTFHELVSVRKVVTRSFYRFLLVHTTCRHANTKVYSHMYFRVHTRNEVRSPEKHTFLDSSVDQCVVRFTDTKDLAGLGLHATWKSVLLSPNRGCENTFCCLTPGLLTVLHVLLPLLPSFTQHFGSKGTRPVDRTYFFFYFALALSFVD